MHAVLNVSAYKFVAVADLAALRARIAGRAQECELLGTVLLAPEGINLVLAGPTPRLNEFLAWLRSDARFADLQVKESASDALPFGKLLVKVKSEIIRMNRPTIRPESESAPSVDAHTLTRWLATGRDDDGRAVVMLDTRNAFEVDYGRFRGAIDWRLHRFSDFPQALAAHRAQLDGKTVVSYCTGGIRCVKAALLMMESGVEHVLQLDGGILRHFEQTGGTHFDGDCFVFDRRVAVDGGLRPAAPV